MKILVTGGAGFIGRHLTAALREEHPGAEIHILDNFSTAAREDFTLDGIIVHDTDLLACMIPWHIYETIYHLACPASPLHYQRDPIHTIQTAVMGTDRVLGLAAETRAHVVIASTSEIYGSQSAHTKGRAMHENDWGVVNPIGPRSCYDEGKRCAEALAAAYHRKRQVDVIIVRLFNVYGPGMALDDGRMLPNFISQAISNKPLTIHGDGSQTRSLCYVSDIVSGLMLLGEEPSTPTDGDDPLVVNLGRDHELPVKYIAHLVKTLVGSRSKVTYLPRPEDDPQGRQPNLERARALFGWSPEVELRDGLELMIEDFRNRLQQ